MYYSGGTYIRENYLVGKDKYLVAGRGFQSLEL